MRFSDCCVVWVALQWFAIVFCFSDAVVFQSVAIPVFQ